MNFVIVTPVYNEQKHLAQTIEGVLAQKVLPARWVIVDDGSTDATAQIIGRYAEKVPWIRYLYRSREGGQTYYASNVYAIAEGVKACGDLNYDFLAILDGDILLPSDYYQKIFERFSENEKLGIASGVYLDNVQGKLRKILNDRRSTPKALMVFRRACYESIGGFLPLKYGGEDTCACFMARMKGWKTWSFPDLTAVHNKPVGTGHGAGLLQIRFRQGIGEYFLAAHPLFFGLKALRRCVKEPPFLLGGLARMAGFVFAHFMREKRQIPQELIQYIRREHLERLFRGNRIPADFQVNQP